MGALTVDQLSHRLAQKQLGGNFFLKTEDPFLRDEAISMIVRAHLDGASTAFDLDQVAGDDADPEDLASRLATPPLIAAHRVLIIRRAQALSRSARTVVEEAISQSVSGRVIVVSAEIPKGSKAKFYSTLSDHCTVVSLRAPRLTDLPGWLARRARVNHEVELDIAAAQLLVSAIGARLGALAQELEKLVTIAEAGGSIGVDAVRSAVGALPQVDRWRWVDKVLEREIGEAVAELPALLDLGESAVGLIATLSESFIRVGLAREGEGVLSEVLKRDGSYGYLRWKIQTYVQQSRLWSDGEIELALEELLRADRLIKSGGLSNQAALEEALLRIGSRASSSSRPAVAARS